MCGKPYSHHDALDECMGGQIIVAGDDKARWKSCWIRWTLQACFSLALHGLNGNVQSFVSMLMHSVALHSKVPFHMHVCADFAGALSHNYVSSGWGRHESCVFLSPINLVILHETLDPNSSTTHPLVYQKCLQTHQQLQLSSSQHHELKMVSKAKEVLNTVELLEAILEYVPARDLIPCQRVSCGFRDTIKGSIKLQRALFKQLPPNVNDIPVLPQEMILNPILQNIVSGKKSLYFRVGKICFRFDNFYLNPNFNANDTFYKHQLRAFLALVQSDDGGAIAAPIHEVGSWKDMFLTQVSCTTVVDLHRYKIMQWDSMTMGDILDGLA